jgi:nucleoid DNA-binding protein
MQDLSNYISGLLFIHDCVILPGFGGFVTNYREAGHNPVNHTFTPPSKDLLFNRNLTYNDGLLISYLSRQMKVSYKEAEARIKQSVEDAWMRLERGESLSFDGIGTFRYNENSTLIFEPEITENLLTDSYGMVSFRFPPLSYQSQSEVITSKNNIRYMTNEGMKSTLRVAAIAIPLIAIIALIPVYRHKIAQQNAGFDFITPGSSDKPIEEVVTALPSDTSLNSVIDQSTDKRVALFYNEAPVKVEKVQVTEGYTYYIISGSFKDEKNAIQHADICRKKGFEPQVINTDNLYRVSLATYTNKVEALHELRRIRNIEQNSNAWLLSLK